MKEVEELIVLATSEPDPTSLTPRQETLSPLIEGAKNSRFNLSLPNLEYTKKNISKLLQGKTLPISSKINSSQANQRTNGKELLIQKYMKCSFMILQETNLH